MTGAEVLIGMGAAAGKSALKKGVDSLCDAVGEKSKKILRSIRNAKKLNKLYSQLGKVRKVKTLGQLDRAVDLMTFYCDSHVYIGEVRKRVIDLDDFGTSENLLIEGIAGQGKSIFLRYLCSVEALKGEFVPIFAELRRIQEHQNLEDFLIKTLGTYHIDADAEVLGDLADSGRLILLLDAFDEVRDDAKARILSEIENFAATHENCRLIISSRPESGISACPLFRVVKLSDLEREEYAVVINKITEDAELAEQLIKQVKQHKGGIQDLLRTPLLVTLLVIRYKSYQELPEQLADFYDSLFQVLLQRHDGIKPGYRRPRGCAMNDYQYRQTFEAFCYISKRQTERQLRQGDIYKIAEAALKERGIKDDPEKFVDDIVKITCLLVKDGEEYRFIHKSVQEYYAAAFVRQKPDVIVEKLYPLLFGDKQWWRFQQELRFLADIDAYRYKKFGLLPYLSNLFGIPRTDFKKTPSLQSVAVVKARIESCRIDVGKIEGGYEVGMIQIPSFGPIRWSVLEPYEALVMNSVLKCFRGRRHSKAPSENPYSEYSLMEGLKLVAPEEDWSGKIQAASSQVTARIFGVAKAAIKDIEREEQLDSVFLPELTKS